MRRLFMFVLAAAVLSPLRAGAQDNSMNVPQTGPAYDPAVLPAAPPHAWRAGSSVTYASGDFGTGQRADIFYVPLTITRYFSMVSLDWTIPYVYKRNAPPYRVM